MTGRQLSISDQASDRAEKRSLSPQRNRKPSKAVSQQGHQWQRSGTNQTLDRTTLDQSRRGAIAPTANLADVQPQFRLNQRVYFVGGCGTVKNCQPYAHTWTYAVEMELGPEPEMGRIGYEATILLNESEIQGLVDAA